MQSSSSGKKLIQNSIIYSLSGVLIKCFSFFLVPLYTVYLTTEDYGITSLVTSFISVMSYVASFSLFSAVKRFYVDYKHDREKLRRFYGTMCSFVFLSGLAIFALLTAFKKPLSKYIFSDIPYFPIIFICLISLIFSCQHTIFDGILKSQQRAAKSSIANIAYFLITVTFNIVFVVVFKMGAIGTLLASLIGYALYTGYFTVEMLIKREICFCLDWKLLQEALKYSIPIMPHNLSTHIATLISKIFIGGKASLSMLGVYTVAAQFGALSDTVHNYISQAYGPWLYEQLHDQEQGYKQTIRNLSKMLTSVTGLLLLGIALFSHDYVVLLVDEAYIGAWRYIPWIVLVYVIKMIYYFFVQVLFYYKKASRMLFVATVSSSLLNVVLSYFLIPAMGVYGSILADGIAMVIRVGIIVFISMRFEKIGLKISDFLTQMGIIAGFIGLGMLLTVLKYRDSFSFMNLCYKALIILAYVVIMVWRNKKFIQPYFLKLKKKLGRKG